MTANNCVFSICFHIIMNKLTLSLAQEYFISENTATSLENAARLCNIAEPDIVLSNSENRLSVGSTLPGVAENQELWLGYVHQYEHLVYEGCSELPDIQYRLNATITPELGQCASFCGGSYTHIGMSIYMCYCITSFKKLGSKLFNAGCIQSCSAAGHICGGSNNLVSIYTKIIRPDIDFSPSGRCLAFSNPNTFKWDQCSKHNKYICWNGTTVEIKNIYREWNVIVRSCLDNRQVPIRDFTSLSPNLTTNWDFWSGVIRSETIKRFSDRQDGPILATGYAVYRNGIFYLKFETKRPRKALCITDSTTTTPVSVTSVIRDRMEVTTGVEDDDPSVLALGVGIPVAVILVLLVIIVTVILYKRRKSKSLGKEKQETTTAALHTDDVGQNGDIRNTQNNYSILERNSGYATCTNVGFKPESSDYNTAMVPITGSSDISADTADKKDHYDRTNTRTNQSKQGKASDLYSTPDKDDHPYNHTHEHKVKHNNVDGDVYNTLEKEAVYDTTKTTGDQTNKSGNVYNVFEKVDGIYDVTDKEIAPIDSTYDHAVTDNEEYDRAGENLTGTDRPVNADDTYSTVVKVK